MKWLRSIIRSLLGHDARYHRQASETTARQIDTTRRARRAEELHRQALALRLNVRSGHDE